MIKDQWLDYNKFMKQKIAKIISDIFFNPAVLAIVILIVAVLKSAMPWAETTSWILAVIVLNGVIPGLFYLFFTHRGYVFDDTLQNKKVLRERVIVFSIFLGLVTFELLILVSTHPYQPLLAIFSGGIITLMIAALITYFWKISIHALMITFFVTMFILIYGWQIWYISALIPLVFWSRLVLFRHTPWQLFIGFLLSLAVVFSTFYFFGLVNF